MKRLFQLFATLAFVLPTSCIENNLPYPVVELNILSVTGEGFTCETSDIDTRERTATLHLEETTDISKVVISQIEVSEDAESDVPLSGTFDLRTPLNLTLSFYQDYYWKIIAEQQIERCFEVESQIGASEIDAEHCIARVHVPLDTDLKNITVKALKLGPRDITTMTPTAEELTEFESVRYVYVSYHDVKEKWSLYVIPTEVKVQFTRADAWSKVLWLTAEGKTDSEIGFRYRKAGSEEWIEVERTQIEVGNGSFSTCVEGVEAETSYEVMAYAGEDQTEVVNLTTDAVRVLPNAGFEEWNIFGKIICPYLTLEEAFWGTGNPGSAIANTTLTDKTEDIRPGSTGQYAAKLESKLAGVMGISRMAAGNLFVGQYLTTRGANGIVGFGRPYTLRPTALRGWMKYKQGALSVVGNTQPAGENLKIGDPDQGIIYIALGTWTPEKYGVTKGEQLGTAEMPIAIDTRDINTFFNPQGPDVIAYGEFKLTQSYDEWIEFTIPLEYRDTERIPTHIVITCTASRWGDYFIGSAESILWLDDFELVYDRVNFD